MSAPTQTDHHRSVAFDNLRGIAVLVVAIYHLRLVLPWVEQNLDKWGYLGVRIFFIVSGYLIMGSFENNVAKHGYIPGVRIYTVNRFFRIMPTYLFNLLIMLLLLPSVVDYSIIFSGTFVLQIISFMLMIGFWTHPEYYFFFPNDRTTIATLNGPYWTLSIELLWYVLVPFLARRSNKVFIYGIFGSCLWLLGLDAWRMFTLLDGGSSYVRLELLNTIREYFSRQIFGQFLFFAIGVLLYRYREHQFLQWQLTKQWQVILAWVAIIGAVVFVNAITPLISISGVSSILLLNLLTAVFSLVIVLLVLHTPTPRTPLTWIGVISYSIYLWHHPIIFLAYHIDILRYMSPLVFVLVYALLTLSIASMSYLFIERGGLELRDRVKARLIPGHRKTD